MLATLITRCGCSRIIRVEEPPPPVVGMSLHLSVNTPKVYTPTRTTKERSFILMGGRGRTKDTATLLYVEV